MRLTKKTTSFAEVRRARRGFTLAELIVVLTILAILAAIGIGSAVGYIRRSRFDQNEQSAITVYQTAQTAMSQMMANGTINDWVNALIDDSQLTGITDFSTAERNSLDQPNESISKRVHLTYNPGDGSSSAESVALRGLLASYFYDQTIFEGTISVEFDISLTCDANQNRIYSARVVSAFYSLQNSAVTGWDELCRAGAAEDDGLPNRDDSYRYTTSYVGYFDGTEHTAKPQVTSVFLPQPMTYELDGHIVGPTVDPNASSAGYLFNLRNGETLDVSWAIFDFDGQRHDDHDENLTITLKAQTTSPFNQDLGNLANYSDVVLTITDSALTNLRYNTISSGRTPEITYERVNNLYDITRTSYDGLIDVSVKIGTNNARTFRFPITVTWVTGDGRTGCPDKDVGYYEYRLSLDCMMIRSDEMYTGGNNIYRYNAERLFESTPRNIYAILTGTFSNVQEGETQASTQTISATYAARAIDDPVYFTDVRTLNSHPTYYYTVSPHMARYDVADTENDDGETVTGMCVVNTLFGDYIYSQSSEGSTGQTIAGTKFTSTEKNAVITAFRHLYNLRVVASTNTITYRIVRDLNWYVGKDGLTPVSEVRVYMSHNRAAADREAAGYAGVRYRTPVVNGNICVVSFPAINKFGNKDTGLQILTSMSSTEGRIYSINNVQMRANSFRNGTDSGYGLVCLNYGHISNIYTNNLNLIMTSVPDGSLSDYSSGAAYAATNKINPGQTVTITTGNTMALTNTSNNRVGGLVGYNCGWVGDRDAEASENVIRMNNSIVLGGNYWDLSNYITGGVIGRNDGRSSGTESTYGVIELRGAFVVAGGNNSVGGIIGDDKAETAARLVVNGNPVQNTRCEYTLPAESHLGATMSCVVAGQGQVGGAIGWFENHSLCYPGAYDFSEDDVSYDPITGQPIFPELDGDDFDIDVNLPAGALILKVDSGDGNDSRPVGGAVGKFNACTGANASIRVINNGSIIAPSIARNINVGGAVGEDVNCTIGKMYIEVNNGSNSVIGYWSETNTTSGPIRSGGAIGYISGSATGRVFAINADNDGKIMARGTGNGQGAGGALGGASDAVVAKFIIDAYNGTNSRIYSVGSNQGNANGAGGAIGGMGNDRTNGNTNLPAGTVVFAENHGTISGVYHVGGAIGNAPANHGAIYAVNYGTIKGSAQFVGGAVGRMTYANYGNVQSILYGATITGTDFIGGAAGRLSNFQDNAIVKTIVRASSTVSGSGSLVGGVCGDIYILGTGTGGQILLEGDGSAPTLTVNGLDSVGGAVGLMRCNVNISTIIKTPVQSATDKLIIKVDGRTEVGGAIGKLRPTTSNNNDIDNLRNKNIQAYNLLINLSVYLHPASHVHGSGDCVGGAIGMMETNGAEFGGRITVVAVAGSADGGSYIDGQKNVGGAIGRLLNAKDNVYTDSGITVDFSLSPWTIRSNVASGNEANVGGAIGIYEGTVEPGGYTNIAFPITVHLGASTVTTLGKNAGGAIGKNMVRNGIINVTMSGSVSGHHNVGGAIGDNSGNLNTVTVTVSENGTVAGNANVTDANIGGAIGYNQSSIAKIVCTISGHILNNLNEGSRDSYGNNVGGAIGYCNSDRTSYLIGEIQVTLQGEARVQGKDNVGGALGLTFCNIDLINSSVTGASRVIGVQRVGGAVGFASAQQNVTGDKVANRTGGYGCIASVYATISADLALEGTTRVGGAIGQIGDKWGDGVNYRSAAVLRVEGTINAASLFEPTTGSDPDNDACVGGVIGQFVDGRVFEVVLSGTGGVAHINGAAGTTNVNVPGYPNLTFDHAVLMAAGGRSVGGIIGQIGVPGYQQNVCLSKISVAEGGPRLCVVSTNGSNCIGGWIGSGYAGHGGIGNNNANDYNHKSGGTYDLRVTYNVNNVSFVYSAGSEVGGFCGRLDSQNGGKDANKGIHAIINVNLDNANINGRSQVGGVFGSFNCAWYYNGEVNITLKNHTNIGDITGNGNPGDGTIYPSICYDAGGAIGYVRTGTGSYMDSRIYVPVRVRSDATSRIYAGGTDPVSDLPIINGGVGGAFGRCYAAFNNSARIEVAPYYNADNPNDTSNTTNPVSIYSAVSNVGGAIGVMVNGTIDSNNTNNVYANASLTADGNACIGGFVGRLDNGTIKFGHADGTISATGSNAMSGGFVGDVTAGTIESCYATDLISSRGAFTGGFVGRIATGTISKSYVGGHTYEGQYISGQSSGNVNGAGNVGGFAGATTGAAVIDNCYTTASVSGSGANVGGFIGSAAAGSSIKGSYSTGLVTGQLFASTGVFAGSADPSVFSNSNKALSFINTASGISLVGGVEDSTLAASQISYASDYSAISGGTSTYTAVPFDGALQGSRYPMKPVISSMHYGDWPLPVNGVPITAGDVSFVGGVAEFEYPGDTLDLHDYINVVVDGTTLVWGEDYTLSYPDYHGVGKATVVIAALSTSRYVGVVSVEVTINEASVVDAGVTLNVDEYEYTGAPIVPDITVTLGTNELVLNTDYYLTYDREGDHTNIGDVVVTVVGMGNYTDTATTQVTFHIIGRDIGDADVTLVGVDDLVYTGSPLTPSEVIVRLDGRTLEEGQDKDYVLTYLDNVDAGDHTAQIIIQGVNRYGKSKTVTFSIQRATNSWEVEPSINGWTYGGTVSTPVGSAKFGTVQYEYYRDAALTQLVPDITTANAGTYYMRAFVDATTNYSAPVDKSVEFTISPADIGEAVVTVVPEDQTYDGSAKYPTSVTVMLGETTLNPNSDYRISYPADVTNPGWVTVTITGINNYTGTATGSYEIVLRHTVIFNSNGGTVIDDAVVRDGERVTRPADPLRDGFSFHGWFTNPGCTIEYNFNDSVTGDFTLYAKWIKTHTITFVTGEGSSVEPLTVDEGTIATPPADPTLEGYVFGGWFTDPGCTSQYLFNMPVLEDFSLFAKWVPACTVTFYTGEGSPIDSQVVGEGGTATRPDTDPVWEGHNFLGWFVSDEEGAAEFDFATPISGDTTIFAHYD